MRFITLTLVAVSMVAAAPDDGQGAAFIAGVVPLHHTTDGQSGPVIAGLVPFQGSGSYTPPPTTSPGYTPPPTTSPGYTPPPTTSPGYTPPPPSNTTSLPSTNIYGSGGLVTASVSLATVGALALLF